MRAGEAVGDFDGVIAAAVVDDDDLNRILPARCPGDEIVEATGNPFGFVVRRNDDGKVWERMREVALIERFGSWQVIQVLKTPCVPIRSRSGALSVSRAL